MKRAKLAPDDRLPRPERLAAPWPGRAVPLDGSTIYVRDTPATAPGAEPALYVHGLGGSAQNWTDLAELLAGRLAGQAIDLPGFGKSDPARRYTLAAFAERVVRWIEYSDRGPVHLFGNSLGGAITIRVAASRPDLVRSLTLVSPAMPFLDPRRSVQGRVVPLLAVPGAERIAARQLARIAPEELIRQIIGACFADPTCVPEQRMAEALEEISVRYTAEHYASAYLGTLRGLVGSFLRAYLPGEGSLWRIAARVRAPTLVVAGRQDRVVDIRVAPQVARAIPDSRLLMLDGVGHVAQMEVPRVVARAALALLDEAAPATTQTVAPRPTRSGFASDHAAGFGMAG
ncbi:alpha/beta fold hydrolase [Rhizomonospora bruguierae]|uniref:alpha/beta fold hydrolase n=1 Tax=Rhizomonospora bruguierae TaxID=1581705 RepID=UPI001BCFE087|nr:alpha/beta hydrolase [Micromonospora sp. NBRC 107566]